MTMLTRVGDRESPGRCRSCPGVMASCSHNTFANSIPACRVGDPLTCCGVASQGAPRTYINSRRAHRIGDGNSCGGVMIQGSYNVNVPR